MRSTDMLLPGVLFIASLTSVIAAENNDRVHIEADSMQMNLKDDTSTYRGNVRFRHDVTTLTGERLIVRRSAPERTIIEVFGEPATFERSNIDTPTRARSGNMHYDERSQILTLRGEAVLEHEDQVIRSDFIRYDTASDTLLAGEQEPGAGGQRVNITINPEGETR